MRVRPTEEEYRRKEDERIAKQETYHRNVGSKLYALRYAVGEPYWTILTVVVVASVTYAFVSIYAAFVS